jgi:hypothetical protein
MSELIPKGLRYIFLIHAVVAILFGVWFFFFIENYADLFDWPFLDRIAGRYIGAFLIGICVGNLFAYKRAEWEKIEIYLIFIFVAMGMGFFSLLWGCFLSFTWSVLFNLILHGVFAWLFIYYYIKYKT